MPVGNLEFIKSASGTSVASLDVTNCFNADYDVYYISITKTDVTSNTYSYLRFLDSVGSVISASEYDVAALGLLSYGSFLENRNTLQTSIRYIDLSGTSTEQGIGNSLYIFNPFNSSSYTFITGQYSGHNSLGTAGCKIIGVHKSAEQITGINYLRAAGSFDSVTINVYGVK